MRIGGFQKVSLIDYPGQISAVVFTQGCNFRCPYCHNPELVDPHLFSGRIEPDDILAYLDLRRGKIDALTVTGGEPTIQSDLIDFIKLVRKMGYLIKLDSNGSLPENLARMLDLGIVDYIAMDVKASPERYAEVTRSDIAPGNIMRSIDLIMNSGIDYEFRTTIVPSFTAPEELTVIAETIRDARRYVLQPFIPSKVLDLRMKEQKAVTLEELHNIKVHIEKFVPHVIIRS